MSYQALYRKYRSSTFDEIYGQETIVKTLQNALNEGKVAHAYLFSGPRGTGKTSIARLFAKALNCEEGIGHICNSCSNCNEISQGNNPDVIEIDAASNSGVDEVRNLIERVRYTPTKSRYKVYIIDEVHMMSNSAFNALLKTLEEPPSYVVFILCTTEFYKVLPTIVSRCQRYEFKKLEDSDLLSLLKKVLDKEGVKYEEEAIKEIAALASGGARDALSILDQAISFSGGYLHAKDIEFVFGLTNKKEKISLLEHIKNKDYQSVSNSFKSLVEKNIDITRFINDLLILLKDSLLSSKTLNNSDIYLSIINKYFTFNEIQNLINVLLELLKELKLSNNPTLITEIYLFKMIESLEEQKDIKNKTTINNEPIKKEEKPIIKKTQVEPIEKEIIKKKEAINPTILETKERPAEKDEKPSSPTQIIEQIKDLEPIFKDGDKTKKPLNSTKEYVHTTGESYSLTMENLISLSVLSNKEAKRELIKRWKLLEGLKKDPSLEPYSSLLLEGSPYLLTSTFLILVFNFKEQARLINLKNNQEKLVLCVSKLLGKTVHVYALNRIESTELISTYRNMDEARTLPKSKDINLEEIKFN